ncbi:MAG TPA: Fur family transcriptional regulator [Gemmatimonadaceae bacterium]
MADQPVIDRFRAWMTERNLPLTPQRLAIADLLLNSGRHLSAEDVVAGVARNGLKVGTATVYRTIDVLLESGYLVEQNRGEGFRRFEANRDLPHHEHLLCTVCGRVTEFSEPALERMTHRVADAHGYVRERHRLVIYGTCADCQGAAERAGAQA